MKSRRHLPLLIVTALLAFGILLPRLGFYWDDWATLAAWRADGARGVWELLGDPFRHRPFSGWTVALFGPLAGSTPFGWQLTSLGLRCACAATLYQLLRRLWPQPSQLALIGALLFLVYPTFLQQPIAVTYHQHWLTFLLYLLSLLLMVSAVAQPSPARRALFTLLALIAQALHLSIFEYFAAADCIRPLLLFIVLPRPQRLRRSLLHALPFLLLSATFIAWRLSISAAQADGNRPGLLFDLLQQPLPILLHLARLAIEDTLHILLLNWLPASLMPLWVGGVGLGLAAFLFWQMRRLPTASPLQRTQVAAILGVGLVAIFLGCLPTWATDRVSWRGFFSNRFGLPATWGAALLWAGLLSCLPLRKHLTPALTSLLIGLAAVLQLQAALPYQTAWQQQKDYAWQLSWRAPAIAPNTAILSTDSIFPGTRRTFALNQIYNQPQGSKQLPLWFYFLNDSLAEEIGQFGEQNQSYLGYNFQSQAGDVLIIVYEPQDGRCLWIPSPADADLPGLSSALLAALPLSNPSRIQVEPQPSGPPTEIFGPPPALTWCHYFQKASLARQQGDWQTVAQLADQASALTHRPAAPYEWLPFLEGYAHTGRSREALTLTQTILEADPAYQPALCRIWQTLPDPPPTLLHCPSLVTP